MVPKPKSVPRVFGFDPEINVGFFFFSFDGQIPTSLGLQNIFTKVPVVLCRPRDLHPSAGGGKTFKPWHFHLSSSALISMVIMELLAFFREHRAAG